MSITEDTIISTYKTMFGLSYVNNTTDENKVLNNAEFTDLSNKLDLIGGTLTGTLYGTNVTFTNDLSSNTSNTSINMIQLLKLTEKLQTQISSLSLSSLSLSNLYITPSSNFPIKIPYSSSTIDQISIAGTGSYFFSGDFRPIGMTLVDYSNSFEGAWGINYNTVDSNVWSNNWTVVTKVWFPVRPNRLIIKFGEKWERWIGGSESYLNCGENQVPEIDKNIAKENIFLYIENLSYYNNINNRNENMTTITNKLNDLISIWLDSQKGVYIIISYNRINKITTIKFCTSDGTIYYNAITNISPFENRRPFHIFLGHTVPIWNFGIILTNTQGNHPIDDINMFKNQFGLS